MGGSGQTLSQHLDERSRRDGMDGDLAGILLAVARAGGELAREIGASAFTGNVGLAGGRNPTGEDQKKLDVVGNDTVLKAFEGNRHLAAVVSEEMPDPHPVAGDEGRYVLCTDPLDGSSNADINGAVGTIFGVFGRPRPGPVDLQADLLRPGSDQVLAGYVMYGPATLLVYTAGRGTHGFTLDPGRGEWLLTHESIRCPEGGPYYSANLARTHEWQPGVRAFVEAITDPSSPHFSSPHKWSLRYTGALVADVHRSLLEGGLYFYPSDPKNTDGKLRLLYECAPLAFIVEQAGGRASTGSRRILDVRAESIHQRIPLVIGSAGDVALYETFFKGGAAG